MSRDAEIRFPAGFLWGAATSAHQVEGGNRASDWWRWRVGPVPSRVEGARSRPRADDVLRVLASFGGSDFFFF